MSYSIRAWAEEAIGTDRQISREVYPEYRDEPNHPAWFPAQQLGAPSESLSRYVAIDDRDCRPIGYATLWELRPRRHRFDLAVLPDWRRQGIGTQLFFRIFRDAESHGATGIQARVRDDQPGALHSLVRRGFRESHRMGAYRVDFDRMPESNLTVAFEGLRARGIDVTTLADVRRLDPQYLQKFHELYRAAREGWPDPDPDPSGSIPVPLEQIQSWLEPARGPEAFFIARDKDRYVAFTSFAIGTAVHPDYRRQGIATLLKAGSIADAQTRGLTGQTTSTASVGMRKVLEKLGYRRTWSEIRLICELH